MVLPHCKLFLCFVALLLAVEAVAITTMFCSVPTAFRRLFAAFLGAAAFGLAVLVDGERVIVVVLLVVVIILVHVAAVQTWI